MTKDNINLVQFRKSFTGNKNRSFPAFPTRQTLAHLHRPTKTKHSSGPPRNTATTTVSDPLVTLIKTRTHHLPYVERLERTEAGKAVNVAAAKTSRTRERQARATRYARSRNQKRRTKAAAPTTAVRGSASMARQLELHEPFFFPALCESGNGSKESSSRGRCSQSEVETASHFFVPHGLHGLHPLRLTLRYGYRVTSMGRRMRERERQNDSEEGLCSGRRGSRKM